MLGALSSLAKSALLPRERTRLLLLFISLGSFPKHVLDLNKKRFLAPADGHLALI